MRLAALIPARYSAQRLPGKPLADIGGAPMVVRVAQRAARAEGIDEVAVATDEERIARAVIAAGFRALMTDPACRNGTERIAQAARDLPADGYLNVQGDEPLVDPRAIAALARLVRGGSEMATVARPLAPGEGDLPQVVKVVLDSRGRALYFSRSLIPHPRAQGEVLPLAHIGLYGFSAAALQKFAKLPETNLERAEGLEQLRALWHGIPIDVAVGEFTSAAVDTQDDLERVRRLFEQEERRSR
ncbi:MAG: 3-deoxy-manno-octulosonate cytidylyltransferase [Deltaproteobacteria bacterium]|nr:MAG: 3-deoxy-manno-octulosonate cytidylyltransferase [Deltaproteobacteria bacterium]